jgi:hypothetical protein
MTTYPLIRLRHDPGEGGDADAEGPTGQRATSPGCWPVVDDRSRFKTVRVIDIADSWA